MHITRETASGTYLPSCSNKAFIPSHAHYVWAAIIRHILSMSSLTELVGRLGKGQTGCGQPDGHGNWHSYGYGYVRHPSHPFAFRFEFAVLLRRHVTCGSSGVVRSLDSGRDVARLLVMTAGWPAGCSSGRQGGVPPERECQRSSSND